VCEFLFVLHDALATELGIDLSAEQCRFETWREAHPGQPLAAFHALDVAEGPHERLLWLETRFADAPGPPMPLLLPADPADFVGAASFARVYASMDEYGYPGIAVELSDSRTPDFERITGENQLERLGFVIEGKVRSAPVLAARLSQNALIQGRFSGEEMGPLCEAIAEHRGPLRVLDVR
jgi:hypothetical protein